MYDTRKHMRSHNVAIENDVSLDNSNRMVLDVTCEIKMT
jgi:hypothetical protein